MAEFQAVRLRRISPRIDNPTATTRATGKRTNPVGTVRSRPPLPIIPLASNNLAVLRGGGRRQQEKEPQGWHRWPRVKRGRTNRIRPKRSIEYFNRAGHPVNDLSHRDAM